MADIFSQEQRSCIMAAVKAHGNQSTELRLIQLFRKAAVRGWRRHHALPGKPDFVWKKERVALFVDGCFWHCCPTHGRTPKTRLDYWIPKLAKNKRNDQKVSRVLRKMGWQVVRVWECDLSKKREARAMRRIKRILASVSAVDVNAKY